MNRNSQPLLGSFFIVFLKHPGALGNHLRTQLGTHVDRALNADGLPGNPRMRLPGYTRTHTTHLYTCTHAPRYPSGDEPRATPGNSAPTGLEPGRAARPLPELATGPLVRSQSYRYYSNYFSGLAFGLEAGISSGMSLELHVVTAPQYAALGTGQIGLYEHNVARYNQTELITALHLY